MKGKKFLQSVAITATVAGSIYGATGVNAAEFVPITEQVYSANTTTGSSYDWEDYQNSLSLNQDMQNNIYINKRGRLDLMAEEIFGPMRDSTEEERASINKYIESISKPTGVNFFDI